MKLLRRLDAHRHGACGRVSRGTAPVFVDCELQTGNIDCEQLEAFITPNTKAISLVHFLGIPGDMEKIMHVAKSHDLRAVEDCALAIGARYRDKHVGLWGDVGCFSFYPVKHITAGEGGLFVTRHQKVAESVSQIPAFGVERRHNERKVPGMYDVTTLGLNYRMSELPNRSNGNLQNMIWKKSCANSKTLTARYHLQHENTSPYLRT